MEDYLGFLLGLVLVKTILIVGVYGFYRDGRNWIIELKEERKMEKRLKNCQK